MYILHGDARRRQLVRCYLQMDGVHLGRHGMAIVEPAHKPVPLLRRTVAYSISGEVDDSISY